MRASVRRRVILTAFDSGRPQDPPLSLGHASIYANLRQHNIPVIARSWSVNHSRFSPQDIVEYAMSHADSRTDIAFGAFVWNEKATTSIIRSLKQQKFPGRIILGGPQISYVKSGAVTSYYPEADIFIRGYAEEALAQLYLSDQEKPAIAGITYRDEPDSGISANVDLEKLPSPYLTGIILPQDFLRWETKRGCLYKCAFCQHPGSHVAIARRNMALSRVLQEAQWITDNPVINNVAVLDPIFNAGPDYMAILDKLIAGNYKGKLALQCRLEMVTEAFLDKIDQLNRSAHIVLEFGLQTIHPAEWKFIERANNLKKVTEVLHQTKKRNIETEISLIFGLPGQTPDSFQRSIEFCQKHHVSRIYAYPLMLLRGTPLHDQKQALGLVESDEINIPGIPRLQDGIPHVVASPSFTYKDWQKMAAMAEDLHSTYNSNMPKETWASRIKRTAQKGIEL